VSTSWSIPYSDFRAFLHSTLTNRVAAVSRRQVAALTASHFRPAIDSFRAFHHHVDRKLFAEFLRDFDGHWTEGMVNRFYPHWLLRRPFFTWRPVEAFDPKKINVSLREVDSNSPLLKPEPVKVIAFDFFDPLGEKKPEPIRTGCVEHFRTDTYPTAFYYSEIYTQMLRHDPERAASWSMANFQLLPEGAGFVCYAATEGPKTAIVYADDLVLRHLALITESFRSSQTGFEFY
jgi:hypothetical protein